MNRHTTKPSRWFYMLAALILMAGMAACAFIFTSGMKAIGRAFTRIVAPGEAEVMLPRAGNYTIYYEHKSVVDGKAYVTGEPLSPIEVSIESKETGDAILIRPSAINATYDLGGRSGRSIFDFTVDRPGAYVIDVRYADGIDGPEIVLTISQGFTLKLVLMILAIGGIGLTSFGASAAIAIVVVIKRSRTLHK